MSAPTVRVDGTKYTFVQPDGDYKPHILRYGEPWVVVDQGCNAVLALMYAHDEALTEIARLKSELATEQDRRSDEIRQRNIAEERARDAESANEILKGDAAKWRKVEPLIERLHRAALVGASHVELITAVADLSAATSE